MFCGQSVAMFVANPAFPHALSIRLGATIVAGQAAVDGLAEQRDQVVADVAAGTAFLEIVGGYGGKVRGVIQFSECQQSGVGGDGGTM